MSDIRVMPNALDINPLDAPLKHVTSAARRGGHIDDSAVGPLADNVDAFVHELSSLPGHALQAPEPVLVELLAHASSATRIIGHLDGRDGSPAVERLADHVDAIVHGLSELLGDPHLIAQPAPADEATRQLATMLLASGGAP
jgi:hypothetical protein